MEGIYSCMSDINFSPSDKLKMFERILSCSEKLKNHVVSCGDKECKVTQKIKLFIHLFLKFEKTLNTEIDIQQIMDEEMVDDSFFSDKFVKILN